MPGADGPELIAAKRLLDAAKARDSPSSALHRVQTGHCSGYGKPPTTATPAISVASVKAVQRCEPADPAW
jgi:hypothetical protein